VLRSRPLCPCKVLQRDNWDDTPKDLGDLFRLNKGKQESRCQLTTHPFGWECRLMVGCELLQSQVCRSQEEVFSTGEAWKTAMTEKADSDGLPQRRFPDSPVFRRCVLPSFGTVSPQSCPECGLPMVWSAAEYVSDPSRGTSAGSDRYEADAYRCDSGHVSDACALCHSRDTVRFGNGPEENQRILNCNACGNTTTITIE